MRALLRFLESRAGRVLRYAVSILLIGGFIVLVDWRKLASLEGHLHWAPVIWGTILAGITVPMHGARWWFLYRAQGLDLPFQWSHVITWIGHFYNSVLLGGLGGDAARVYYVCRDAPDQKAGGLASIALDRVMGLLVLLCLIAVTATAKLRDFMAVPELRGLALTSLVVLVISALTGALLIWMPPGNWPAWIQKRLGTETIARLADLHRRTLGTPGMHAAALSVALTIWVIDFISIWLLAAGLGLHLPFLETCIAVSVAYAATALPISVGGHGIREGALIFTLGAFGLVSQEGPTRDSALLLAVLVWAVTMLWSILGGVVLLLVRPDPGGAKPLQP